jgi:hypothetical protein
VLKFWCCNQESGHCAGPGIAPGSSVAKSGLLSVHNPASAVDPRVTDDRVSVHAPLEMLI